MTNDKEVVPMSDHVMKALSKHDKAETEYDPDWESWIAGEHAAFLRSLIEQGPDEEMMKARLGYQKEPRGCMWTYEIPPLLEHLATRLEAIAQKEKG